MNQILMQERRGFQNRMGKIATTNQIIDHLQNKLNHHFQHKKTEEHLLNSQDQYYQETQPPKTKPNFKLFSKINSNPMNLMELQSASQPANQQDRFNSKLDSVFEPKNERTSQVGQLLQEVEAIETLVRKRLGLKQERINQLQRQIQTQNQEKHHQYKRNCQLEEELSAIIKNKEIQERKNTYQEQQLEQELKRLKKIHDNTKKQNGRLKKQEQLLKSTLRDSQRARKGYIEMQIKANQSKPKPVQNPKKQEHQQNYLRGLVIQLDKLRNMVKQKMKKSTSKSRIR